MLLPGKPQSYDLTKEEWQAMSNLAEDWSIIKPANKGLFILICDQEDYLAEDDSQSSDHDHSTYTVVEEFTVFPLVSTPGAY